LIYLTFTSDPNINGSIPAEERLPMYLARNSPVVLHNPTMDLGLELHEGCSLTSRGTGDSPPGKVTFWSTRGKNCSDLNTFIILEEVYIDLLLLQQREILPAEKLCIFPQRKGNPSIQRVCYIFSI
jgi:hypothetical protein